MTTNQYKQYKPYIATARAAIAQCPFGYSYLRIKIKAAPTGPETEVCADSGCGNPLIDRKLLKSFEHTIEKKPSTPIAGISGSIRCTDWATFSFYAEGKRADGSSAGIAKFTSSAWVTTVEPGALLGNAFLKPYVGNIHYDKEVVQIGLLDDFDNSFKAEQRHQHDKAHALWKRFTTVVMLDEQMRAAGDPELQRLLKRIRLGVQDRTDLNLLNSRNRWNLNMEASLAFRVQQRSTMRIFISEHKWKEELPTEEEAIMILNQGDDSAIPVPAVFMFVAGMPIVVNHNTHQGLKLVNGASYSAVEVIVDKAYPGHRISADMTIHFGRRRDHSRIGDDEISPLRRDAAGHDLVDTHDR
ncbi:PIF1 protein [Hirsutella rhossiliensis]|uniref:PIF1 protein n=1 Tax=Hirsutella rhossiliensis TaxID=111463 RepID=A0A9P8MVY9_9HYPO|nr:PIF1 protein [Hirsutella rhossiliensis]KAH0961241.1 PIF1 protein [Hirsutella rhossiliensis]